MLPRPSMRIGLHRLAVQRPTVQTPFVSQLGCIGSRRKTTRTWAGNFPAPTVYDTFTLSTRRIGATLGSDPERRRGSSDGRRADRFTRSARFLFPLDRRMPKAVNPGSGRSPGLPRRSRFLRSLSSTSPQTPPASGNPGCCAGDASCTATPTASRSPARDPGCGTSPVSDIPPAACR